MERWGYVCIAYVYLGSIFCCAAVIHSFIGLFDECLCVGGNGMGLFPSNHPSSFAVSLIFQLMKLFKGHEHKIMHEWNKTNSNITAVLNEATTRCNTHRHICMPHKVSWSELMMYNTHMPKLSLGYMLVHCLTFNIHSSLNVFCSGEWKQNITVEQRYFYGKCYTLSKYINVGSKMFHSVKPIAICC